MPSPATSTQRETASEQRESHARGFRGLGWGFLVKLALMALINAFGIMTAIAAWRVESWIVLGAIVVLVAIADWVYFTRGRSR